MGAAISFIADLGVLIILLGIMAWIFYHSLSESESASVSSLPVQTTDALPYPVQCQEDLDSLPGPAVIMTAEESPATGIAESSSTASGSVIPDAYTPPQVPPSSPVDDSQNPLQCQDNVDQGQDCIPVHGYADEQHTIVARSGTELPVSEAMPYVMTVSDEGGGGDRDGGFAAGRPQQNPAEPFQTRGGHVLHDQTNRDDQLMPEYERMRDLKMCRKCGQRPFLLKALPCGHLVCSWCFMPDKCCVCKQPVLTSSYAIPP